MKKPVSTIKSKPQPPKVQDPIVSGAGSIPAKAEDKPRTNPVVFFNQVRAEARKITWPSRKETWITSAMVLIMVVVATLFFAVVDASFGFLASLVLRT